MKQSKYLAVCALFAAPTAFAADACPFPGQTRVLQIQMFFGQEDMDGRPIGAGAFAKFLETAVTPRFPSGFTIYDGQGQWLDPDTKKLAHEKSKILQVHGPDSPEVRKNIEDLSRIYRQDFHQKAVGIVTNETCASFY